MENSVFQEPPLAPSQPETHDLVSRIDAVVTYNPLNAEAIEKILDHDQEVLNLVKDA